jgi:GNAT superfamily N-acetyltransferase
MMPIPQVIDETGISARLDAAIRDSLCRCFPDSHEVFSRTRAWHGSPPTWTVLVQEGETVIAHAGIADRTIRAGEQWLRVAGVQNVCVLPEFRGCGWMRSVMAVVAEEANQRGYDAGLLFCTLEVARRYQRLGWHLVSRPVTRIDEHGQPQPLPQGNHILFCPLRLADLPPGILDLQGNDW